jgi:xylulokinase
MKPVLIVTVDIGSTRTKAALFDESGHLVAKATCPSQLLISDDRGKAEADPMEWLSATEAAVRQVTEGVDRNQIAGMCIASQGPTLVALDEELNPTRPALLWMDYRAHEEARCLSSALGRRVDPSWIPPKALWLFHQEPRNFACTRWILQPLDYVSAIFTGEVRLSIASEEFDALPAAMWEAAHLPPRLIPPRIFMGEVQGKLLKKWAQRLLLPEGIPVVAGTGGVDALQVILGTATLREGLVCDKAGTSEGIEIVSKARISDERFFVVPHPLVEGHYHLGAMMSTTGKALEWFRSCFYPEGTTYRQVLQEASRSTPGACGLVFLPYLMGERSPVWDKRARGLFFGLSLAHRRADFARSVLEGVALGIDQLIMILRGHGVEPGEIRVAGGPARSSLWNQIKADITGLPVRVCSVPEVELLGLAIIAGYALHLYPDLKAAAETMVRFKKTVYPRKGHQATYEGHRRVYEMLYPSVKSLFAELQEQGSPCVANQSLPETSMKKP